MTWRATVLTIFPEMLPGPLAYSLAGKAHRAGLWQLETVDIRDFAGDKHRSVDDAPFGGGPGMVMRPDVLDAAVADAGAPSAHEIVATIRGSAVTEGVRVIVLTGPGASDRAAGLDLGADDAISRPWDAAELLARVRAQLRVRRADQQLLDKMHLAEEGQQIAYTAFDALAVTERMASDAVSLNRRLKMGLAGVFAIAVVMAGTYFLFAHSAQKDIKLSATTIARLERGRRGLRRSVGVGQHQAAGLIVGRQSDEAGPNADEQRLDHLSFSRQTWDE